jgi:hypothetical protein
VGLASTKHLKEVWALLEHLGRTRFLRAVFTSPEPHQVERPWGWALLERAAWDRQGVSLSSLRGFYLAHLQEGVWGGRGWMQLHLCASPESQGPMSAFPSCYWTESWAASGAVPGLDLSSSSCT